MSDAALWATALGGLGAILGSFIAALVIRWPLGRSVATGRSACDHCARTLTAVELVPLLSAAWQRGRCRGCGVAIDPLHWQVEAAALLVGVSAGLVAPGPTGIAGAAFGWLLLALAALDWRAFWLPDRLTLPLAIGGVLAGMAEIAPPLADRAIGGVAGFALLRAIATGYRAWRGREGMGGGDPKLFGAIGLWLGWRLLPAVLMFACLIGLAAVLWRSLTGRAVAGDQPVPLGALLAIAAYPAWLAMIAWPA